MVEQAYTGALYVGCWGDFWLRAVKNFIDSSSLFNIKMWRHLRIFGSGITSTTSFTNDIPSLCHVVSCVANHNSRIKVRVAHIGERTLVLARIACQTHDHTWIFLFVLTLLSKGIVAGRVCFPWRIWITGRRTITVFQRSRPLADLSARYFKTHTSQGSLHGRTLTGFL